LNDGLKFDHVFKIEFMINKMISLLLVLCIHSVSILAQVTITPINGWTMKEQPGSTLLNPEATTKGSFSYTIYNSIIDGQKIVKDWFEPAVVTDMLKQGYTETQKPSIQKIGSIWLYITMVTDKSSQKWYVCYLGYHADNNRQMARTQSLHKEEFEQYTQVAVKHFTRLAMDAGIDKKEILQDASSVDKSKREPIVINETPVKQGQVLKATNIHAIIIHLEYRAGMGGAVYPYYIPYILLKDGSIYSNPEISPYDLDAVASKKAEPEKWGTWKMAGSNLVTNWPAEKKIQDREMEWKSSSFKKVVGATRNQQLLGSYKSISGTGNTALGGNTMVAAVNNISFNSSGQFTLAKAAGVSGSGPWENSTSKSNEAGTYILQDYMIELRFYNGTTQRRFFYFYPDSKDHFGIGGSVYRPVK
jgi:hypothetical protein